MKTQKHIAIVGILAVFAIALGIFAACDNGTSSTGSGGSINVPPENLPVAERWGKWVDVDSTATLVYSVDTNGVCTITVGGVADQTRWKANAQYRYTATANTCYTYVFEAWTQSGARELGCQYYNDEVDEVYINSSVTITETPETYTVKGQALPKGGGRIIEFQCADQLGTFYVKNIRITEYEIGELTITNFSGIPGFAEGNWVSGDTEGGLVFCGGIVDWYSHYAVRITGSSITLDAYIGEYDEETETGTYIPYIGNDIVAAGDLGLIGSEEEKFWRYKNKVPITFTNGKATINFGEQMELNWSYDSNVPGTLTITNFSGNPGLPENEDVAGYAKLDSGEWLWFSWQQITGSSINFPCHYNNGNGAYRGDDTVAAGNLWLRYRNESHDIEYTNKVPITFTNGNATINFGEQMELKEPGTLTITNFSGNPGLTENGNVAGYAALDSDEELSFTVNRGQGVQVTGSSITLEVRGNNVVPYIGNDTVAAGNLVLVLVIYVEGVPLYRYTNKVPITFTNGDATINFGEQMKLVE